MVIELDEGTIHDIHQAIHYMADESFVIHCGYDLISLYKEQGGE